MPTADGAYVVNEPQGSPGWYPVNDSPKDKATFDIVVTVPAGRTVMANGELISQTTQGRQDDLALARADADGALPRHGDQRHVPDQLLHAARAGS